MKSKHVSILLVLLLFFPSLGMAKGSEGGGGGDDIGLEFQSRVIMVLDQLSKLSPKLFNALPKQKILDLSIEATYVTVDKSLEVEFKDIIQNSVATNNPETKTIYINRKRWKEITEDRLRNGIALHEVLSLAKIEQTGSYPISAQYVVLMGGETRGWEDRLQIDSLLQAQGENPGASSFAVLEKLYASAIFPARLVDFDYYKSSSNMRCAEAKKNSENFESVAPLQIYEYVYKYGKEAMGPLFPKIKDEKRWVLLPYSNENFLPESLASHIYLQRTSSDLIVRFMYDEINTEHVIVEGVRTYLRWDIRAKNKLLISKVISGEGTDVEEWSYIYCWRN